MVSASETRDERIARIARMYPNGDLAYLLARLTAAEPDADRLAELLDRKAPMTPTNSWLDMDFVMHSDFVHQPDVAEALRLHDEAVAIRERP